MLNHAWMVTGDIHHLESIIATARLQKRSVLIRTPKKKGGLIHPHGYRLESGAAKRLIYDCRNTTRLPGFKGRFEGDKAFSEAKVNMAYEELGAVRDFLWQTVGLNSLDGNGADLIGCVRYSVNYNNAYYDDVEMVFGDGDGVIFVLFIDPVIAGHELYHGVTAKGSGLQYYKQSGCLNESNSDAAGITNKQYKLKLRAADDNWLIGDKSFGPTIKGRALRDMLHPGTAYDDPKIGKDRQPDHMSKFVETFEDNGGVHTNSGIPNKAFATFAMLIGGYTWEAAFPVWHFTNTGKLKVDSDCEIQGWADRTAVVCSQMFPQHTDKLVKAWDVVGITVK